MSRTDYATFVENNMMFLGATQIANVCSAFFINFIFINKIENRKFSDLKLTLRFNQLFKGFLIGALLITLSVLVMQVTGKVSFYYQDISYKIVFSFFLYFIIAVGEEIVIRGYVLNNLREKLSDYWAILISSIVFGAIHFFNDDFTLIGFINICLSGFILGIIYLKSDTISAPIGLHWAWNFIQGSVAGFNVSGHKETGIFHVEPRASEIWTGGAFGAEGSILLIPIVLIAIYVVWKYYTPVTIQVANQ